MFAAGLTANTAAAAVSTLGRRLRWNDPAYIVHCKYTLKLLASMLLLLLLLLVSPGAAK
jgi:hypothetical protein